MNLTINELQDIATDMLESVVHICETYHLPYIAMYGSLIGAIRHHGPIPWDYDIDIAIPENSLDKFLNVMKEQLPPKYYIEYRDNRSYLSFPRIGLRGYKTDVLHIDVYRTIGYPESRFQRAYINKIRSYVHRLDELKHKPLNSCSKKMMPLAIIAKPILYFIPSKILLGIFDSLSRKYPYDKARMVACSINALYLFDKVYFDESILVPYAGFSIRVPKQYDLVLKTIYGDYMQFPSEEEQKLGMNATYVVEEM